MFWFILIILIIALIAYRFLTAINEDNKELKTINLSDKFKFLVDRLNDKAFNSEADIHIRESRSFCLHLKGGNQLIEFFYSTGHLNIKWKLKFPLEDEVIYEKQINDVRNLEANLQIALADEILEEVEDFFRVNCPNSIKYYYKYNKFGFLYHETALKDVRALFIKELLKNETDDLDDVNLKSFEEEDKNEKDQLNYTNLEGEFNQLDYPIDVFSGGLINLIDSNITKRKLDLNDYTTTLYILDILNHATETAKETLRNSVEFNFDEDEINEISEEVYKIVYYKYFKD